MNVWSQGTFSVLSAIVARRDSVWPKQATGVGVSPLLRLPEFLGCLVIDL